MPSAPPATPPALETTGPGEGWPPTPKGVTNLKVQPAIESPDSLNDARISEMLQVALQDPRVKTALGQRFAYVTADEVDPGKGQPRPGGATIPGLLTFFSHGANSAVIVRMTGRTVDSVEARPGFYPPAGADEIKQSVTLARADQRLVRIVDQLEGRAMVITPRKDQAGAGHRVLYVTFSKSEEDRSRFFANVDLTDQKVLLAGPVAKL